MSPEEIPDSLIAILERRGYSRDGIDFDSLAEVLTEYDRLRKRGMMNQNIVNIDPPKPQVQLVPVPVDPRSRRPLRGWEIFY